MEDGMNLFCTFLRVTEIAVELKSFGKDTDICR